jgi:hypothetical protein
VRFGLALHVGQVLYGNIGSGNRLDFTCIGPAVNLAARIEKLTGKLQRTISASDDFARQCGSEFVSVGKFDFAGFTTTRAVFGLEEEGEPDLLTPDGQITWNPVQPWSQKYFAFLTGRNSNRANKSRPDRGAFRDRHERGAGCGGREARLWRTVREADGEVVWSWCLDAGIKSAGSISLATVTRKPDHRGEREVSR